MRGERRFIEFLLVQHFRRALEQARLAPTVIGRRSVNDEKNNQDNDAGNRRGHECNAPRMPSVFEAFGSANAFAPSAFDPFGHNSRFGSLGFGFLDYRHFLDCFHDFFAQTLAPNITGQQHLYCRR